MNSHKIERRETSLGVAHWSIRAQPDTSMSLGLTVDTERWLLL